MKLWLLIYLGVFIFGMAIRPQAGRGFSWLQGALAGSLWCLYTYTGITAYRTYNHPNENLAALMVALVTILVLRLTLFYLQKRIDRQADAAREIDAAE